MKTIHIASPEAIPAAAQEFLALMGDETVYTFTGEMGAGKTTFISALCAALGVDPEEANSPSFAIANEYRSETTAELIYHFDLYRLESLEEVMDIGFEDYLDSGALCLIEWPEKVADILPDDTVRVNIRVNDDNSRDLIIE
ncbi:MAG: tRNA (adenosine(37)-N6)-threonylcarbamoyltransferase complex ATPase subunit type 1 TsaE [Muribaculaceae bacterium]|nr:tRNA (adenosine(37)-N6)-threonylcarbamoyltransferase complex ATPase subunit type 1 TsaE [Muribaculaceae bacterium]MCI9055410.1 tRNA (adenosine(37)-N6)-threonylcarbamoyltransferase complex ATPase subunit type 1 TsaE [Muribaculaceae bacterium]